MPLATEPKLAAGTAFSFEDPDGTPDIYLPLPTLLNAPALGSKGEFIETTPISAVDREYIAGRRTPDELEFKFNDQGGDANYTKFLDLADASRIVKFKVETTTGRTGILSLALNGWKLNEPEGDSQLTTTVYAKQSGKVTWSVTTP